MLQEINTGTRKIIVINDAFYSQVIQYFKEATANGWYNCKQVSSFENCYIDKTMISNKNVYYELEQLMNDFPDFARVILTKSRLPKFINTSKLDLRTIQQKKHCLKYDASCRPD